jgi:CDP-diacylglycerol--glycerol-3-phosphate 3-phosphatidyltransferase
MWQRKNIPNLLTYFRIGVIPLLVLVLYLPDGWGNIFAAALFLLAAISDYFDGYLARNWQAHSSLGRFLDPIADKLLVAAVIVALVDRGIIADWHCFPAIAILCREILVSGLREHLAELRVIVPVSRLAKWKTAAQMVALFLLLLGNYSPLWLGLGLLWFSALLTVQTGYLYLKHGMKHF